MPLLEASREQIKIIKEEPFVQGIITKSRETGTTCPDIITAIKPDITIIGKVILPATDHFHVALTNNPSSAIITISVGREQRLFAAHEDVLSHSPWFQALCNGQFFQPTNKRIDLPDEEPEVFSSILEYLYKGDYYPRMEYNKKRNSWSLEDNGGTTATNEAVIQCPTGPVLKDTVIYCQADKYGLQELKKLALKKQGLQSGVQCSTVLTSARYAYANTPDTDSKLRAHYLALIIRARNTFKRSGTMQSEMEHGGKLFFDLFVAMVNHMDDLAAPSMH
ncbi:btb poz [Pyrenophora seminiperda CCB06]|uniref:Btb poz n=1 Tax=Pyrenophora seminiperda CCB06 TaxID=1302712 RepID=A0A3M7LZ19_9PLEO|nr:btb poz [Pyrenophora seminiperda CCB06]